MTRCTPNCVSPTPHQAHCPNGWATGRCHQTFGGVSLFDKHRVDGKCLDPITLGMTLNDRGVWRIPMDDEAKARMMKLREES